MRYEDASGAFQASGPIANDDADTLSAGQRGPATGNLITGEGTQYGAAGADSAADGHITAIAGKGGEDSSFSGGKLSVAGEHGRLTVDADGNYSYLANGNVENVRDRFTYTLADNAGNSDTAALIVEIGKTPAVIKANAQQIVPGPDGVVTLPPGVELSDVHVVGRNLVVDLPDGTQLVIIDGAIFVPQLQLGGVEVPATNVAALLIGQEIQPAAGEIPPSGGGNFALPPPPLDPGIPLGDLIPPTELTYVPPEPQDVFDILNREPEIFVQPDGQPASVAAVDQVEEAGLPTPRNGNLPVETAGSGESADGNGADNDVTSETTAGNIVYDSPDGVDNIALNGVVITSVGQVIAGAFGDLTITSIAPGVIGYSYTLDDNTSGNDTHDDFSVVLTDTDGDVASATLRIDIIDDVPTARPDTDAIASGQFGPVTGNVITDASAGDAGDSDSGADTVGADNALVSAVSSVNVPANSDSGAPFVVNGQYGVLTLQADGNYSYTRNAGTPGGVNDVFNYTLTDGDGDSSTTTLTISIADAVPETRPNPVALLDDDAVPGAGGNPGGVDDDVDAANLSGNLVGSGGDGPLTFNVLLTGAPAGFSYVSGGAGVVLVQQGGVTVLTVTVNSTTGAYTVVQNAPIDHPAGSNENNVEFTINYTVTDQDGDSANGTLGINVDDDTPTATNDVDSILGTLGPATGNVITGVDVPGGDANATDGSADSDGADSPGSVTRIASNNVPANVDAAADGSGNFVVAGQYGVLTINANGDYSYLRSDGTAPGSVQDVFTYTFTDGDGDSVTATLTINIVDNAPTVGPNALVQLDDDALPGGNPGGTDDDPDSVNASGTLSGSGGDGALTFAVLLTGAPAGFTYASGGAGVVLIQQGGVTVLTVTVNSTTGAYTVVQNAPIDHPDGLNENNASFTINYTVTDADGDSASGTLGINVDDDTPTIDVTEGSDEQVSLTTDDADTIGGASDSASTSANFGGVFGLVQSAGADGGAAASLNYALGVSAQGVDSGLNAGGLDIHLYLIGGVVVGSTSATEGGVNAGNTVFDVTVSATGVVTLTQHSQIDHPIGSDPSATGSPFADHILSIPDALVTLTASATITDNDNDSASDSESVNIGANLRFTDDGPDVAAALTGTLLKLDETDGVGVPGEVDPAGGNLGTITVNAATLVTVSQPHVSADSPTSLSYSLVLSSEGVASGLLLSSNDAPIFLYENGGVITGSTSATEGGINAGNTAFTISINSGTGAVTMTQFLAVEHPTPGTSHDEDSNPFAAGVLNLRVTATDFDGDTDFAQVDLGSVIRFEDDGPSAQNDVDVIVGGNGPATGNVMTGVEVAVAEDINNQDGVADNVGSDTPGSITSIDHASAPAEAVPAGGSTSIDGDHGTLTIFSNGDYSYLRTSAAGGVQDVFTYTLTDADGDTVTATLTISIDDNFPELPDPALVRLDDDVIPGAGGNVDGPGDDDPDAVPGNVVNGNLAGTGGDAPLTYNFTGVDSLPSGFSIGAGSDADTLLINQGTTLVMTIQLNQATGAFTVTQNAPMLHPADNGGPEDNIENNFVFSIGVEVEDADGDVEPATITINVDDDTPTIDVTEGSDTGVTLTTDDLQTIGGLSDTATTSANFGGVFGLTQSAGADGAAAAATLSYTLGVSAPGVDSGLDQGGSPIFLYLIGGKVVGSTSATQGGVTAGNTVFDVAVSATGVVTLTQYSQIDHPIGSDPTASGAPFADHIVSMADALVTLTASATLTDNDGDEVSDSETVNIGANLRFTDDGPDVAATLTGTLLKLDETDGVGVPGEVDPVGGNLGTITVAAAALVTITEPHVSADTPQTLSYTLVLSADGAASGLQVSSNNAPIFLYNIGGVITGSTSATLAGVNAGNTAFTVSVNSGTGAVTMTQFLAVEHGTPGASHDEDSSAINAGVLNLRVTATDFDGDTDQAQVDLGSVIRFEDDGPRFGPDVDPLLEILNDATPSNTGDLDIVVGSDSPVPGNDVISVSNFTVSVNGVPVAPADVTLTPGVEDATSASYTFSFDYDTGNGGTATANGTLVFNKAAGTYTVSLTNGPVQGFTVADTATGEAPVFYNNEHIGIVEVADGLFMQFTGYSSATGPNPFGHDDVFGGTGDNVHISSTEIGVHGNALQDNEVVDFEFMTSDPGAVDAPPGATAQTAFIQLGQFNSSNPEDVVLVLKLADPADPDNFITRTIVVEGTDILDTQAEIPAGFPTLGTNEAMIIVGPEDYINLPGVPDNYEIAGMQIRPSTEGLPSAAGEVYNFDGDVGEADNTTTNFTGTSDNDVLKIVNIGAVIESTEDQEAVINFDVTIIDADGDTATQHITVDIGDTQSAMEGLSTKDGSSSTMEAYGSTKVSSSSLASPTNDNAQMIANNVGSTGIVSAMVAASGLAAFSTSSLHSFNEPSFGMMVQDSFQSLSTQMMGREGLDEGLASISFGSELGQSAIDTVDLSSSSFSFDDHGFGGRGLDAMSFGDAEPAYVPSYASGEPTIANIPAFAANVPTVSMASAEMLRAASLDGNVQHGGAVEQVLADALGNQAPTIDAVLANLPGGIAELGAIANLASGDGAGVPAWDMMGHGAFGSAPDMVFKVEAIMVHQDAVQPA